MLWLCISSRCICSFDEVFKIVARSYAHREQFFNMLLNSDGGNVHGLDNLGHYNEFLRFWSPGQAVNLALLMWTGFDQSMSCVASVDCPRPELTYGFYTDDYYFGILTAKTHGERNLDRTMDSLLGLTIPNLRVVRTLQPLGLDTEMQHEEERFDKLGQ